MDIALGIKYCHRGGSDYGLLPQGVSSRSAGENAVLAARMAMNTESIGSWSDIMHAP